MYCEQACDHGMLVTLILILITVNNHFSDAAIWYSLAKRSTLIQSRGKHKGKLITL